VRVRVKVRVRVEVRKPPATKPNIQEHFHSAA